MMRSSCRCISGSIMMSTRLDLILSSFSSVLLAPACTDYIILALVDLLAWFTAASYEVLQLVVLHPIHLQ